MLNILSIAGNLENQKMGWGDGAVVTCLPCRHEEQRSTPKAQVERPSVGKKLVPWLAHHQPFPASEDHVKHKGRQLEEHRTLSTGLHSHLHLYILYFN